MKEICYLDTSKVVRNIWQEANYPKLFFYKEDIFKSRTYYNEENLHYCSRIHGEMDRVYQTRYSLSKVIVCSNQRPTHMGILS